MQTNVGREIAALARMGVADLRAKYAAVFGEATATGNRTWLVRRIAWRIQALAEGDLSERARARAAELARDADLRTTAPKHRAVPAAEAASRTVTREAGFAGDGRLPPPGGVLTRKYKGQSVQVKVLSGGFEYAGEVYASLSAVAKAVTGSHCNGYLFFRLTGKGSAA
jgi:Protein of unknown function (DUF2924)